MKKMSIWLLCAALLLAMAGCTVTPNLPSDEDMSSTPQTSEAPLPQTSEDPASAVQNENDTNWNGQGGGYGGSYVYTGNDKHTGMKNLFGEFFLDTYGRNKIDEAYEELNTELNAAAYSYTGGSMHRWVRVFDVPKETFIEINNRSKEFFKDSDWGLTHYTYTDEEIHDFYNLSTKEFNQKYKSSTAALVGEVLFPFSWFIENPVETWQLYDFTVEQLQEILTNAKANPAVPADDVAIYETRLGDYIDAVTE